MITFQQYARYEKYRIAHEWRQGQVCLPGTAYMESEQALSRLFAAWFAESDWDDPAAAWIDWDSRVRHASRVTDAECRCAMCRPRRTPRN